MYAHEPWQMLRRREKAQGPFWRGVENWGWKVVGGKQDLRALCSIDSGRAWQKTRLTGQQGGRWRKYTVSFVCFFGVCWWFSTSVSYLTEMVPSHSGVPDANVWSGVDAKPHLLQTLGKAVTLCRPASVQIHPPEWLGNEEGGQVEEAKVKECTPPWASSTFKKYNVYYLIFFFL